MEKLQQEGVGSGEVVYFFCDISTPLMAKKSAEEFLKLEERLDVLGTCSFIPIFRSFLMIIVCHFVSE